MVQHLGLVEFGQFVTVTSLVFVVAGLTEAGLTAVGVREYTDRTAHERIPLLRSLQGLRAALTLGGIGVAVLFSIAAGYEAKLVTGVVIAGVGLVLSNALATYQIPLMTELRLGWLAMLDLLRQLVTVGVIVALVLLGSDLLPFFAIVGFATIATALATIPLVRRQRSLLPAVVGGEWMRLLRQTAHFAIATALGVVYYRIVILFMSIFSSDVETGIYSVSFRIVEVAIGIPWLLVNSAFPLLARAARDDQERLRYALQRLFEVAVIAGAWLALITAVGAPFAIDIVVGERIDESVRVLQLLGGSLAATFLIAHWGFTLLTLKAYRALLVANLSALVTGVAFAAAFVPWKGAFGGALASLITEVVLAATYGGMLVRLRPDLRPGLRVVIPVALAVAASAVPAVITDWPSLGLVFLSTGIFFTIIIATRALPPELAAALLKRRSSPQE